MFYMKIYLATGNLNKKREISQVLPDFEVVIPKEMGIEFDPEETGTDFYQNSMIKALDLWHKARSLEKEPPLVMADDSGICVDALAGAPGVWSARYAGPDFMKGKPDGSKISQDEQNKFLIEQTSAALKDGLPQNGSLYLNGPRSCHYACSMVLLVNPSRFFIAQETMEGSVIDRIQDARGTGGFGYDPIIYIPSHNKTVAELTADQKNAISHRGKATRAILEIIKKL